MSDIKLHEETLKNIADTLSINIKEMEVLIELIKPNGLVSKNKFKSLYNKNPKNYKRFTYVQNNEKKSFLFLTDICEKTLKHELSKYITQKDVLNNCSFLRRKIKLKKTLLKGVLFSAKNLSEIPDFLGDLEKSDYRLNNGIKVLIQEDKTTSLNEEVNRAKKVIIESKNIFQRFNKIKATDHNLDKLISFEKEILGYLSQYNNLDSSFKEKHLKVGVHCQKIIKYIDNQKTKATRKD